MNNLNILRIPHDATIKECTLVTIVIVTRAAADTETHLLFALMDDS